ncbi:hypothetical protein QTP70_001764 [Hemibagrus guttatus]|uniref:ribonuclease H n=1 Tax=Hemibagrus guttatus TaxID=175788 RepID=A0AAE0R5I3_9TELE|nr:hypothetical protein QTP70_001764 [Hemibagrus guttatus]
MVRSKELCEAYRKKTVATYESAPRMDPAATATGGQPSQDTLPLTDPAELRAIIVRQGALIRSYQDQVEALQSQLHSTSAATPPPPRDPPAVHGESPRLAMPEKYDGSADRCCVFLRQCEVFFVHQPGVYHILVCVRTTLGLVRSPREVPEPMQLGRSRLMEREHQRRAQMRLCYYCGGSGHLIHWCPERPSSAQTPEPPLTDRALVEELRIPTIPYMPSLRITAIGSQPIGGGSLTHQTKLLEFQVGLFHWEHLAFYVTSSPASPVILGFPWLRQHDPQISWHTGELVRWSATCLSKCLHEPVASVVENLAPLVSGHIPHIYGDFLEVFSKERAARLPLHRAWDCAIDLLPNTSPPRGRVYPLSLPEVRAMEYIKEALAVGHIRPSTSPAAVGFFFVGKKDRGLRPCIDYRGLNAITVCYPYPLPLVPAALEQLRGAKFFTKLDLHSAYNLVRSREGDEWKTAFHTTHGHYEYLVMPFGLTNAPAEYVCHVWAVLSRLQQNHLYVKPEKCEFHRTTITFLGYVILQQGVEMDLTKVQAVTEWPNPTTVKELQRFLRFANFYRRFIRNYSSVAGPLTSLL